MIQKPSYGESGSVLSSESLLEEIAASKRTRDSSRYQSNPKISLIVQSYNHCGNIGPLIESFRAANPGELIVCEDGSVDDSLTQWAKQLDRRTEFIIRSNDVHEIRTYDRAISFSRGEIVVLCQDDDIPPAESDWMVRAVSLFDRFPDLAIVGLRTARYGLSLDERDHTFREKVRLVDTAVHGSWFAFVAMVNVGPMFVRRRAINDLGGIDLGFSPAGWPGIHFDFDLCLRAWLKGWKVGWLPCDGFKRSVGGSGTKEFGFAARRQQQAKQNAKLILTRYEGRFGEIRARVRRANDTLRQKARSTR